MSPTSWNTPTMAELYFKQGHLALAVQTYRAVLAERPTDAAITQRLAELERLLADAGGGTTELADRAVELPSVTPPAPPENIETMQNEVGKGSGIMGFREHMQRVADGVPGLISCTLMGFDGIAIDAVEPISPPVDIPTFLAEYASATTSLRRAAEAQPVAGLVQDMVVQSQGLTTVLRPLTNDYFLAAILTPQAVVGKARFLLRLIGPNLIGELG